MAAGSKNTGSKPEASGAAPDHGFDERPPDLLQRIRATAERALRSGALQPIETQARSIEHEGTRFSVRVARNLERKRAAGAANESQANPANPFLPHEEALFVASLGATHLCLLNKFNVLPDHALIVTRVFEEQESLLGSADFAALADSLERVDGLCSYNAGAAAGASQRHKHLQLVPTPLDDGPERVPIERLLEVGALLSKAAAARPCRGLPFRHALIRVDDCLASPTAARGAEFEARYHELRAATACEAPQPYNLLATREWMLLVPRTRESSHGIEVNSLGLAGAMFVRDADQFALLASVGPMQLLRDVTFPVR